METVVQARYAMGTRFEVQLHGTKTTYLESVAEEVLNEVSRLEAQLSLYRSDSDIRELNVRAAWEPIPVEPRLFRLLQHALRLTEETEGAFDMTVTPLLRCWGFLGGSGQRPTEAEIAEARQKVGRECILLEETEHTVSFTQEGVMLDLGAIGKGYAIARAAELLRDYEITSGLIHGGTSTVYALGSPPDAEAWSIAIQRPFETDAGEHLRVVELRDAALSVSAPHGKGFEAEGRRYGHVLDPRTGYPTQGCLLAAVILEDATESDALSTALLVHGPTWLPRLAELRPPVRALTLTEDTAGAWQINTIGAF